MAHLYTHNLLSNAGSTFLAFLEGDVIAPIGGTQTPLGGRSTFEELTGGVSLDGIVSQDYSDYVKQSHLVAREMGLLPGQKALVVNGRVSRYLCLDSFFVNFYLISSSVQSMFQLNARSVPRTFKHSNSTSLRSVLNQFQRLCTTYHPDFSKINMPPLRLSRCPRLSSPRVTNLIQVKLDFSILRTKRDNGAINS